MAKKELDVLKIINLEPSEISLDYLKAKQQFQLHDLLTEKRHEKTWNLSELARTNTATALNAILSVDEDISAKFQAIGNNHELSLAVDAMKEAMRNQKKIYFYGCGATGRLSKQMESSFWRPFWEKVEKQYPERFMSMKNMVIGEMTGGDRALISSLEGLEDLQLVGELQLKDHGIQKGDVVFAVTEGGETSSVIGTILTARKQYMDNEVQDAQKKLFFVFNNPEDVLTRLDRSRIVLEDPAITKIPLWTGCQAITGSTRMQATTSEQFLLGIIMEQAVYEFLTEDGGLSVKAVKELGFSDDSLHDRLLSFIALQKATAKCVNDLAKLTDLEAEAYKQNGKAIYWAEAGMVTVFTDSTERSPTFRTFPLDTVTTKEKLCWLHVVSSKEDPKAAWLQLLHRPFKGLESDFYKEGFETRIEDPFLRGEALRSLARAGKEQELLYDFSKLSIDIQPNGIGIVCLLMEDKLTDDHKNFLQSYGSIPGGKSALVITTHKAKDNRLRDPSICNAMVPIICGNFQRDPLEVRQHIGMKMALNAHSTCVMAKMGRLVGNTMTNVSPANLKLIGRATNLILMHVNDKLSGKNVEVSYPQANAILYDMIRYAAETEKTGKLPEVALSIVRILEVAKTNENVTWEKAQIALDQAGDLEAYLKSFL